MTKMPADYIKEPYTRILIPNEDGSFSAEILEFPGCFAEGETADEAIHNLEEAAQSWIEASLERGLEIPEPSMNQGYSGKIALRLSKSLHRQAVRMAEREGVSLNQFLTTAIAARLGAEDFYSYLAARFERRMATTAANIVLQMSDLKFQRAISSPKIFTVPELKQIESSAGNRTFVEELSNA